MTTAVLIREARPGDDAAVGELLVTSFMTAYAAKMPEVVYSDARKRDLRDVLKKRAEGRVLVAELDGVVVGTVMVYPPGAAQSEAWLDDAADIRQLAVLPEHFGKGFSDALMNAAEAEAWAMGANHITLHVRRGAHGVGRLYERRGYQRAPEGDLQLPEVSLMAYVLSAPPRPGDASLAALRPFVAAVLEDGSERGLVSAIERHDGARAALVDYLEARFVLLAPETDPIERDEAWWSVLVVLAGRWRAEDKAQFVARVALSAGSPDANIWLAPFVREAFVPAELEPWLVAGAESGEPKTHENASMLAYHLFGADPDYVLSPDGQRRLAAAG